MNCLRKTAAATSWVLRSQSVSENPIVVARDGWGCATRSRSFWKQLGFSRVSACTLSWMASTNRASSDRLAERVGDIGWGRGLCSFCADLAGRVSAVERESRPMMQGDLS